MDRVPRPGTSAPDFVLPDQHGKPLRLADLKGRNVILVFYPADWSPVCTNELVLFQEMLDEIRGYDAEVVAISVDNWWSHRAWADAKHLQFRLLSDFWPHGFVAGRYGVFRQADGTAERALFFIDGQGMLRDTWVAEDPSTAPGMNLVLDALARMQGGEPRHV